MSTQLVLTIDEQTVIDDTYDTEQEAADAARGELSSYNRFPEGSWSYNCVTKTGCCYWPDHAMTIEISDV